jgi:hypothetical protein
LTKELSKICKFFVLICLRILFARDKSKECIIKMEGNTGEFSDIAGSEIHEGRSVQSIR